MRNHEKSVNRPTLAEIANFCGRGNIGPQTAEDLEIQVAMIEALANNPEKYLLATRGDVVADCIDGRIARPTFAGLGENSMAATSETRLPESAGGTWSLYLAWLAAGADNQLAAAGDSFANVVQKIHANDPDFPLLIHGDTHPHGGGEIGCAASDKTLDLVIDLPNANEVSVYAQQTSGADRLRIVRENGGLTPSLSGEHREYLVIRNYRADTKIDREKLLAEFGASVFEAADWAFDSSAREFLAALGVDDLLGDAARQMAAALKIFNDAATTALANDQVKAFDLN